MSRCVRKQDISLAFYLHENKLVHIKSFFSLPFSPLYIFLLKVSLQGNSKVLLTTVFRGSLTSRELEVLIFSSLTQIYVFTKRNCCIALFWGIRSFQFTDMEQCISEISTAIDLWYTSTVKILNIFLLT